MKYLILLFLLLITFSRSAISQHDFKIKCGIDVLIETDFEIIKNKKVALLTNFSGRTRDGELSAEVMSKSDVFKLVTIFTPEHGFYSTIAAGTEVADDKLFGVKSFSLYGANRKPTKNHLKGLDAVVVDIQDIGIRSYTYISTVYYLMEACAEYKIPVIICDRPNPIGGNIVDGNTVEKGKESFIGIVPVSYIHGCTIGELAEMFKGEKWFKHSEKLNLTVIKMQNWTRDMRWEDTGLIWFPTSPNIPTVNAVRGAAMLGTWGELAAFNIGIGTTLPFQYIGLPDCKINRLSEIIESIDKNGFTLSHALYKPSTAKYTQSGYLISFVNSSDFTPFTSGIKLGLAFREVHPEIFDSNKVSVSSKAMFIKAVGTDELYNAIFKKASDEYILKIATKGLENYKAIRSKYLLYD
jgi:uncharacterized protein YbbC (DUF1343 family)